MKGLKRGREAVAADALRCAMSHEPGVRLIGNVTAAEIATLISEYMTSCPSCGAEPWVNIDCDLCMVLSGLQGES